MRSSEIRIKFNLWQILGCKKLILAKTEQEFFCLKNLYIIFISAKIVGSFLYFF